MINQIFNRRLAEDYREMYKNPVGKRVLDDIMKFGGITKSSFVPNDPCATSFAEGMRRVSLRILSFLKKDITKLELNNGE